MDEAVRLPPDHDAALLEEDLARAIAFEALPQPGPYHDGSWRGISLHAQGGRMDPGAGGFGCEPFQPTPVLAATPMFQKVLDALPAPKQAVRLLSLPPGAVIGRHFDAGVSFRYGLLRLHVPIRTHPDVRFLIGEVRCDWKPGELWYGNFNLPHEVKNESQVTRWHLVADVLITEPMLALFPADFVTRRRKEGISLYTPPLDVDAAELERFICKLTVPLEVAPLFRARSYGKLAASARPAQVSLRISGGRLVGYLDEQPWFALERVGGTSFRITGGPPGAVVELALGGGKVTSARLVLKGLPKDLYAAALGSPGSKLIDERVVPLTLC
jgi:hypothetical protein